MLIKASSKYSLLMRHIKYSKRDPSRQVKVLKNMVATHVCTMAQIDVFLELHLKKG